MIVLNVRIPGKTIHLSIGRGNDYCGVWAADKTVPSSHRIVKDRILEYLRSNVSGKSITDLRCDEKDRCVAITLHDKSEILFFWKGRRLHFSHTFFKDNKKFTFSPWKSLNIEETDLAGFELFDEIGRKELDIKLCREGYLELNYEKLFEKTKIDNKSLKKAKRKVELIRGDLAKCQLWQELHELAVTDQLDLSSNIFKWKGLKIKFDRDLGHYQKRDLVFDKVKKLRKGEEVLISRLKDAEEVLSKKEIASDKVIENIVFPIWSRKNQTQEKRVLKKEGSHFFEWNNIKIAIGTSAQANDELRKNWAKKDDTWFHLDEYKSAHLFVKGDDQLMYENIQVYSSILAEYSDFIPDQIPIIYTKVSNLKGIKGIAGTVNYKKEKHLLVQRVNWKEIISTSW